VNESVATILEGLLPRLNRNKPMPDPKDFDVTIRAAEAADVEALAD